MSDSVYCLFQIQSVVFYLDDTYYMFGTHSQPRGSVHKLPIYTIVCMDTGLHTTSEKVEVIQRLPKPSLHNEFVERRRIELQVRNDMMGCVAITLIELLVWPHEVGTWCHSFTKVG